VPLNGGWRDPWLPLTARVSSVAQQREDEASFLSYCRRLIAQRRANPDLVDGDYESIPSPDGVWAFRRGEHTRVAVNLTEEETELEDGSRLSAGSARRPGSPSARRRRARLGARAVARTSPDRRQLGRQRRPRRRPSP